MGRREHPDNAPRETRTTKAGAIFRALDALRRGRPMELEVGVRASTIRSLECDGMVRFTRSGAGPGRYEMTTKGRRVYETIQRAGEFTEVLA